MTNFHNPDLMMVGLIIVILVVIILVVIVIRRRSRFRNSKTSRESRSRKHQSRNNYSIVEIDVGTDDSSSSSSDSSSDSNNSDISLSSSSSDSSTSNNTGAFRNGDNWNNDSSHRGPDGYSPEEEIRIKKLFMARAGRVEELRKYVGRGSGSMEFSTSSDSSCKECTDSRPIPTCEEEKCGCLGIGDKCSKNSDCACGLACQGGKCACVKPPPPQIAIQKQGSSITITWSPVPGADYYDIYLFNSQGVAVDISLFFVGTVVTYSNLPPGIYHAIVFSGSNNCGSLQQFTQSPPVQIGSCTDNQGLMCPTGQLCNANTGTCVNCLSNTQCIVPGTICSNGDCVPGCTTDTTCPIGTICQNGQCVTPQCTLDINCPQGQHCSRGTCVAGCVNSLNCPLADPVCSNGTCVACAVNTDCGLDSICTTGTCSCAIPTITGTTVTGTWPNDIQFTFHVTNAATVAGSWPKFTIPWLMMGGTGQTVLSGLLTLTPLPNNQWPIGPGGTFVNTSTACTPQPCCNAFAFGCTASGCAQGSNTVFEFQGITVTNSCGKTSVPTCWRVSSLCPGGPTSATQFTC